MPQDAKQIRPVANDAGQCHEVQQATDYGIDVSMLIDSLSRSCTQRIIRHQAALNMVQMLRKARPL